MIPSLLPCDFHLCFLHTCDCPTPPLVLTLVRVPTQSLMAQRATSAAGHLHDRSSFMPGVSMELATHFIALVADANAHVRRAETEVRGVSWYKASVVRLFLAVAVHACKLLFLTLVSI